MRFAPLLVVLALCSLFPVNARSETLSPTGSTVFTGDVAFSEFGLSCYNGSRAGWLVELKNFALTTYPANWGVRIRDAAGTIVYDNPNVFSGRVGTSWPVGRHFLIAGPSFGSTCGVAPDLVVTALPDTLAGSVQLSITDGTNPVWTAELLSYGTGNPFPPPVHAKTLRRTNPSAALELLEQATPTNAAGASTFGGGCYASPVAFLGGHIQQVAAGTTMAGTGSAYLQLTVSAGATWPQHMVLEIKDHFGAVTLLLNEFAGSLAGLPIPSSGSLLIGGPGFADATGLAPDIVAPLEFDPLGSSIRLYLAAFGGASEYPVDAHSWTAGQLPLNGIREFPIESVSGFLTYGSGAKNRAGETMQFPNVYGDAAALLLVVKQMMFACATGDTSVRFLEIGSHSNPVKLSPSVSLRVRAHDGTLLSDTAPFGARAGQTLTPTSTRAFLMAPRELSWRLGLTPDGPVPALDPTGGWVTLCMTNSAGDSIAPLVSHAYGSAGGLTLPPPGASLWRKSGGTWQTTQPPTLHTFTGATARLIDCASCASALVSNVTSYVLPGAGTFAGSEDTLSVTTFAAGTVATTTTANLRAGTLHLQGTTYQDFTSEALLRLDLEPGGVPLGTAMPVTLELDYVASSNFAGPPPQLISGEVHSVLKLVSLTAGGASDTLDVPLDTVGLTGTLHLPITLVSGALHRVSVQLYFGFRKLTAVEPATFDYFSSLRVNGLPPGAWLRSCSGFEQGTGTPPPLDAGGDRAGLALSIEGGQPVRGALRCSVTLPRAGAARLALHDLAGRRVAVQELRGAAPGRHVVTLATPGQLRPGMYVAKLDAADGTRTHRVIVIR